MECDDPYKIVANYLAVTLSPSSLNSVLTDKEYVLVMIKRELKDLDYSGIFLDCIIGDFKKRGRRLQWSRARAEMAKFLLDELDLPRLRREVKYYGALYGKLEEPTPPLSSAD